jgi:inosose dehydratase
MADDDLGCGGVGMNNGPRVAGAPISWGIIEVPDWGYQMPADRLLSEAASAGLTAMEAGPEDFLPSDPAEVSGILAGHGLTLVGGFVPAVLHEPQLRREGLDLVERRAKFFAAAGADTLVLAAATGSETYEEVVELDEAAWRELFENLARVGDICEGRGLTPVLHSHYGTVVETDEQLWRFLEGCDTGLCLDTGHLVIGGSDPIDVAEKAADRVKHVHLKDVDREVAGRLGAREIGFKEACLQETFRPLGDGDVDVARLLELLERSEYRGWYVLEQDVVVGTEPPEGEGPVGDIRKSLGFLESSLRSSDRDDSRA